MAIKKLKTCREHLESAENWLEKAEVWSSRGESFEKVMKAVKISQQHLRMAQAKAGDGSV